MNSNHTIIFEILRHPSEFEKVRKDWEVLQWNPYYDIDYLIFKYKEIETDVEPYIFVINSDEQLKTIIAGELKRIPIQFQIGYKRWYGPKLKTLVIHRYGVLGESNDEIWKGIENYTQDLLNKKEIDAVLFRGHSIDSPVHKLSFPTLPKLCKLNKEIIQEHWQIDCNGGFEKYKIRHPSFWKNVKNYKNRIYKLDPKVKIVCYDKLEELGNLLDHTENVAKNTWQRKLGGINFNSKGIKNRYEHFIKKGKIKGFILYLNNNPSAFLHGVEYSNTFFVEVIGFDPIYKKYNIGTYLNAMVIKEHLEKPEFILIDYGEGNSEAKRLFCDKFFNVSDKFIIAPLKYLIKLNIMRGTCISLHLFLKKFIRKGGVYHKIRSAWRHL